MVTSERPAAKGEITAEQRPAGASALAAVPVLLAAVLLLIAICSHGAFAIRHWGPLAVFSLVALAVARPARTTTPALVMVAAAWAYALWSVLSLAWAQVPGNAIEGGARNLLYAALITLPVLTLPSRSWGIRVAQIIAAGVGVVVLGMLVAVHIDGVGQFLAGRLDEPVGYRNATAALFALGYWPLACVAAKRTAHPLLRAVCFALGVAALGLAFLTQSRGVVLGFAAGGVTAVVLGPERLRRIWITLLALAAPALAGGTLLDPFDAFLATNATQASAVTSAVDTLTGVVLACFAVSLALALLDGGLRLSDAAVRNVRVVASVLLAVVAVAAAAAGLAKTGDPVSFAQEKVHEFKDLNGATASGTRLGSTSGQRYDLWRIAWAEFRSAPVGGVGEGSYEPGYYLRRATDRNLDTPHSLPLELLAETGLVGFLLLGTVFAAAFVALARGWRTATLEQRRWASALAAGGVVLAVQSCVDWFWLIPGLSGLGLLCLAVAVAIVTRRDGDGDAAVAGRRWLPARILPLLAAALVVALCLSDLDVRTAQDETRATSAHRLALARSAARLNPFASTPRYLEASALEEEGNRAAARRTLLDVLHREPNGFVTMALLGDLETRAGNRVAAKRWYRRALRANPRDTGLQQLAR